MPKPANTAGNGTQPPGAEKMHNTRANTRASSQASSQTGTSRQTPLRNSLPPQVEVQKPNSTNKNTWYSTPYVVRNEALSAIAIRLKEITDNCKCVEDFITNINSLVRYARKAAANDPGTVVHLSLGDLKEIQEDVKSDLSSWYVSIEEKINKLESKQDNILKATTNFDKQAEVLQITATEIENQMSKVANVNNNIANLPTPYRDALIGGNAKKVVISQLQLYTIEMEQGWVPWSVYYRSIASS